MSNRHTEIRNTQVRSGQREFVVVESPIPPSRALGERRPLAMVMTGGAFVLTVWVLGVLATAGSMAASIFPAGAVARVQPVAPVAAVQAPAQAAPHAAVPHPALLQSRSSDAL